MTDLYQQAQGSKGYGPQDWEVVRRMAPGAMLLWVVPVEPDHQYLLDWAVDVGGDNYRPDMQEIREVLNTVLGVGEETP